MPAAAVDTSVLVGLSDSDDPRHATATDIVRGMDSGNLPTGHVTNYVVLETLNWIHSRRHRGIAVDLYTRLSESAGFEIRHAPQKDFPRAFELFETYEELSFGDATIAAYVEREGIDYLYSFDDDFDAVSDLARLDVAENPFE